MEAGQRPPANELPEKYANPKTSGFAATVTADGKNEFQFDLSP